MSASSARALPTLSCSLAVAMLVPHLQLSQCAHERVPGPSPDLAPVELCDEKDLVALGRAQMGGLAAELIYELCVGQILADCSLDA